MSVPSSHFCCCWTFLIDPRGWEILYRMSRFEPVSLWPQLIVLSQDDLKPVNIVLYCPNLLWARTHSFWSTVHIHTLYIYYNAAVTGMVFCARFRSFFVQGSQRINWEFIKPRLLITTCFFRAHIPTKKCVGTRPLYHFCTVLSSNVYYQSGLLTGQAPTL